MGENGILLVRSNRGDYKFPGGGVIGNEDCYEALLREVSEETGYIHAAVKNKLGTVVERKIDEFVDTVLFQLNSHYYLCKLVVISNCASSLKAMRSHRNFPRSGCY
ncbi:NUDIX hydrolase [Cytobacillus firmus]|uniref:NUDIX hydrolase n=1 Tax=Cytobacillus firmus TaxID=1399 RepID=UPI0037BED474